MEPPAVLALPPEEGARRLALSFLDQAAAAWPRLADPAGPADAEALHDFRVALRRLRSCLRAYGSLLEGSVPKKLLRRLRRLAAATGPGRDTEVQIEWVRPRRRHLAPHHRAGQAWLLGRLEQRMREASEELRGRLAEGFPGLESELRERLSVYRTEVHLDSGALRPTLAGVTAEILRQQAADLDARLARIENAGDDEASHRARIAAKRVRYLLEPFAAELPAAAPLVKRLKALQDLLGELHDAHVLESALRETLEIAAAERARRLLDATLQEVPDEKALRTERRRAREAGLLALARQNRDRRDRLFAALHAEWLAGAAGEFFGELEQVAELMSAAPEPPSPAL